MADGSGTTNMVWNLGDLKYTQNRSSAFKVLTVLATDRGMQPSKTTHDVQHGYIDRAHRKYQKQAAASPWPRGIQDAVEWI